MILQWRTLNIPLGKVVWVRTSYHYCSLEGTFTMVDVKHRTLRFVEVDLTYPLWLSLREILSVSIDAP